MGLAASQARLLSLTARMHDIEYKAQNLEAQKLQMANKSQQVYAEYEDALNRTKVQYKTIGADGSASYKDATLYNLVVATGEAKSDYIAHNIATNQMYTTKAQIELFNAAQGVTVTKGADGRYSAPGAANTYATEQQAKAAVFAASMGWEESASFQALYNEMYECALAYSTFDADGNLEDLDPNKKAFIAVDQTTGDYAPNADVAAQFKNNVYLTNMLQEGFIVLHKMTGDNVTGKAEEINIATDTALQEVPDELELKKAEAKYEADMRKINAKDKKFDVDIAALEQERNAIKTEMETLKTVAKDNVERTFKLFS